VDLPRNRGGMHYEVPLYLSRGSCRSFRRRACGVGFVGQHDAPEVCGEVSFERPRGVARWFALGDFLVVVRAAGAGRHPDLDYRDRVDRGVQLPVSVAGQPVLGGIGAGDLDGGGAGVVRVRRG
jgi:hypothetical protein